MVSGYGRVLRVQLSGRGHPVFPVDIIRPFCPDKIDKQNLYRLNDLPKLPGLQLFFSAYFSQILFHLRRRMLSQ
jgi:hypothetical protein